MRQNPILEGRNNHLLCWVVLLFFKLAAEKGNREEADVYMQDLTVLF